MACAGRRRQKRLAGKLKQIEFAGKKRSAETLKKQNGSRDELRRQQGGTRK